MHAVVQPSLLLQLQLSPWSHAIQSPTTGCLHILLFTIHPPAVATAESGLYPANCAAAIDSWLATARSIEAAAAAWCQPTAAAASAEDRAAARAVLEPALAQLDAALAGGTHLAGGAAPTIADVAVLAAVLPLFQEALGADAQQQHAGVARWLAACAALPQFAAVLGEPLRVARGGHTLCHLPVCG